MNTKYTFYTGDKNAGGIIRPSNWMQRIAAWTSTFRDNRLVYNSALTPVVYNNRHCLRIDKQKLKEDFPEIYECVIAAIISLDAKLLVPDNQ